MHLRLADALDEPEERGRHLAMGSCEADEWVAEIVEQGAATARAKGSVQAAAELFEHAVSLTPVHDGILRQRRVVRAAELYMHAGERSRSRVLLEELLGEPLTSPLKADALRLLGELCLVEENVPESERLLTEALALATPDPRAAARIQGELAYVITLEMDFPRAAEHARQALTTLRGFDDGPLLAEALVNCAMCDFLAGRGADLSMVEEALELEDPNEIGLLGMPPSGVAATLMMYVGQHDQARQLMGEVRGRLADRGDERDLATTLLWSSWLETRAGHFETATRLADEAQRCAELAGFESMARWALAQRAWVDAHLGHVAEVRHRVDGLSSDAPGVAQVGLFSVFALCLIEVSVGDYNAAWQAARMLTEVVEQHGILEPMVLTFLPDALEAMIALGELDRAGALLDAFEGRGRELDRVWALCTAARCRGLLLAERGDLPGAAASLEQALAEHDRMAFPFDRARALLAMGVVQRRSRRRASARDALEEAASEFERLSAQGWAQRARDEIDRIGGRKPASKGELTAGERRVAGLATNGLSNKEIAAALFVSVHTVEVHLSSVYAKLGIRSRSQLARALAATTSGATEILTLES
jgi:DNA-binding CsgD family transcriptional regulator/tetratricopeptide (TPR) repeat protein